MAVLKSPKNNHKKKGHWIRFNIKRNKCKHLKHNRALTARNLPYTSTWRSYKNHANKVPNILNKKVLFGAFLD